jgi:hypothetical protein
MGQLHSTCTAPPVEDEVVAVVALLPGFSVEDAVAAHGDDVLARRADVPRHAVALRQPHGAHDAVPAAQAQVRPVRRV